MTNKKSKIDINDASHPSRQKAIAILEAISEKMGKPRMFDCTPKHYTRWYDYEDMITEIIAGDEE